jgi:tRNA 2-selenouridine synthase
MAIDKLDIENFLELSKHYPILDVRSPGEYGHAHIPGAQSLPLFTDEERKVVGTAYKQESREKAIKIGLQYFGVKMLSMVETVEKLTGLEKRDIDEGRKKSVLVHCWRGGMRSAAVAWLLDLYGFKVYTLVGGYKKFRNWVLTEIEKDFQFNVVGGYTGSGKTEILKSLKAKGEPVIDLENLAHHKGSAFGNLGEPPQPSQEMFENLVALELLRVFQQDKTVWLEDESQRIGLVNLPAKFYVLKQSMPLYFVEIPFEQRLDYIVSTYGKFEKEKLVNAIIRIKKRLGPLETKTAIHYLVEDDIKNCFAILLKYYDKWYGKSLMQGRGGLENHITNIPCTAVDAAQNAIKILNSAKKTLA